jgi:hypothetical protein
MNALHIQLICITLMLLIIIIQLADIASKL